MTSIGRRNIIVLVLLTVVAIAVLPAGSANGETTVRPNVVLVFLDDLGWGDFSCFGNEYARTPHVDRMADEGLRFSQFYVNSPICSPSRVAISTGQYPQRWRITSFLSNRAENWRRGMDDWLDPSAPVLSRFLQDAGYATGHFGKWHMGGQRNVGDAPLITEYGFDTSLTNFEGLGPRVLPLLAHHDDRPPRRHDLGSAALGKGPIFWEDRSQVTARFVEAAIDFIEQAQEDGKPFYINLWPDDPHSPFFPPEDRRGDGSKRDLYYGVVVTMDEQLGVLFDYIRSRPDLRDNTLVLICSDNGHEQGAGTAGPLRGAKTTLYEGGIRSPLIVWGPGLLPSEKAGHFEHDSFFAAVDLVASLYDITGTKPPEELVMDGENMAEVLIGKKSGYRSQPLFFRRPPDRPGTRQNKLPDLAVRAGDWKLLCEYDGSQPQLYNMADDPGESNNLAAENPGLVQRLTAAVLEWHAAMPPDEGPSLGF